MRLSNNLDKNKQGKVIGHRNIYECTEHDIISLLKRFITGPGQGIRLLDGAKYHIELLGDPSKGFEGLSMIETLPITRREK